MQISLNNIPTKAPDNISKESIKKETAKLTKKIAKLTHTLMAEKKQALLVVFQGMDSSGKDGATKNVFCQCSPHVVKAHPFKKPTDVEFAHDFLWRAHAVVPAKGEIGIFTRSHYEDILIQRVHNWIDMDTVEKRMAAINNFEELLVKHNNTRVVKFYMHLSPEKQLAKLQERIDVPEKNWKHNDGDWEERKFWVSYKEAYEYAINKSKIAWNIVPVDSRWYRDYSVAKVILEVLESMNPQYPLLQKD